MVDTKIKEYRVRSGLSLRGLGAATYIPFNYIAGFEKGRTNPTPEEISKICVLLGVSLEDLYPDPLIRRVLFGL